jgi:integrase
MSDFLIETLQRWNDEQRGRYKDAMPEWVFTSTTGTRIDMKNIYHRVYIKSLTRAGIACRRLHDLRHTFATILIMNGESMAYVRDQLGHKNISMTVNTYTHWIPGSNRKAMNGLPTTSTHPKTDDVIHLKKAE